MAMHMQRGNPLDGWVKQVVRERKEVAGRRTATRVYEMMTGEVFEVVWSGEDRDVCFNAYEPFCPAFLLEFRSQQRRSGKGGTV